MTTDTPERERPSARKITLRLSEDEEWWAARDEGSGVASQGATKEEALANLEEALAGYHGKGSPPTDEELREIGIDPANNESGSLEDSELFE